MDPWFEVGIKTMHYINFFSLFLVDVFSHSHDCINLIVSWNRFFTEYGLKCVSPTFLVRTYNVTKEKKYFIKKRKRKKEKVKLDKTLARLSYIWIWHTVLSKLSYMLSSTIHLKMHVILSVPNVNGSLTMMMIIN